MERLNGSLPLGAAAGALDDRKPSLAAGEFTTPVAKHCACLPRTRSLLSRREASQMGHPCGTPNPDGATGTAGPAPARVPTTR